MGVDEETLSESTTIKYDIPAFSQSNGSRLSNGGAASSPGQLAMTRTLAVPHRESWGICPREQRLLNGGIVHFLSLVSAIVNSIAALDGLCYGL